MKKLTVFSIIFLLMDLFIKLIITNRLELYSTIQVIPSFFNIVYVRNTGAAFSILEGSRFLFIIIAFVAIYLIYEFLIKNNKLNALEIVSYSMLIGGITGNLLDRIVYGYVIDYLSFEIFNYNFPVFNLADVFIVISILLILVKGIKEALCKS